MRECWNWQTGTFEGRVSTTYGFKSRLAHQMIEPLYPKDAEVFVIFGRAAAPLTTYQKKKGAFP